MSIEPQKILCTMACLEVLRKHQGHLYHTIGSIYKLYESMPDETLRKYLEAVMSGIKGEESKRLIESEKQRLRDLEVQQEVHANQLFIFLKEHIASMEYDDFIDAMTSA